ncbi:MAG: hypothetical protein ACK4YP_03755 [Myxococcota bacterium]
MLLALLLACEPSVPEDTGTPDTGDTADAGDDGRPSYTLVVATVASDYSAGQLATVRAHGEVTDALLPTTSDPVVEVQGDRVFLLDRSSENTVRMYAAGDWSQPLVELSTGDNSNPQDAALCGDTLVVSTYAGDALGLYDAATGLARGAIDLSAWDDGDGSPEPDTILPGPDGDLYVTLNRVDTTGYPWTSADGTGALLRVDCETLAVTADWTVGPNPSILPHPADPAKMLLRTGDYYHDDYTAKLDGALYTFDPAAGTLSDPLLTEEDFGKNIGTLVGNDDGHAILVGDDAYSWGVWCVDLATGDARPTPAVDSYIGDAVAADDGTVWIAYRAGYAGNGDPVVEGLVPWDPSACTAGEPVSTLFPPYSLALLP